MRSAELEEVVALLESRRREAEERGEDTLIERRRRLDGLAELFPMPDDVPARTIDCNGVPARRLDPPGADIERSVLYLHGGGYNGGSPRSHSELAARIARAAGTAAILPEYRLAPENPFPAALEDALTAYRWLVERDGDARAIALAGDSAGGGLAVALMAELRDRGEPLPRAAALLSPWVDLTCSSDSWREQAGTATYDESMIGAAERYLDGADPRDPRASPLFGDLGGLPALLIQAGTEEVLHDDALALAKRAGAAGVEVELEIGAGLIHVWQLFPLTPEAVAATARIARFIATRLG